MLAASQTMLLSPILNDHPPGMLCDQGYPIGDWAAQLGCIGGRVSVGLGGGFEERPSWSVKSRFLPPHVTF